MSAQIRHYRTVHLSCETFCTAVFSAPYSCALDAVAADTAYDMRGVPLSQQPDLTNATLSHQRFLATQRLVHHQLAYSICIIRRHTFQLHELSLSISLISELMSAPIPGRHFIQNYASRISPSDY